MERRKHAYAWSGVVSTILIIIGIYLSANTGDYKKLIIFCVAALLAFTLLSCLILANNFIGTMVLTVFSWGFVRMPGVIFQLDLDGIIWLLTVKLLLWILGITIALFMGCLALVLGAVVSVFVYPFALHQSYQADNKSKCTNN